MNTAIVNVKVDPLLKSQAQQVVEELGLSLSGFINASLKQLVRTREVSFDLKEEPNEYMIKALAKSAEDIKAGRVSPVFDNADDAIDYLRKMTEKEILKKSKRSAKV